MTVSGVALMKMYLTFFTTTRTIESICAGVVESQ